MADEKAEFESAVRRVLRVPKEAVEEEERKYQEGRRAERKGKSGEPA